MKPKLGVGRPRPEQVEDVCLFVAVCRCRTCCSWVVESLCIISTGGCKCQQRCERLICHWVKMGAFCGRLRFFFYFFQQRRCNFWWLVDLKEIPVERILWCLSISSCCNHFPFYRTLFLRYACTHLLLLFRCGSFFINITIVLNLLFGSLLIANRGINFDNRHWV